MCCNGSACVESLMKISLYNKVCKEMQYIYAVFCFLKLSTYLLTPPRTLKPIFSVIISSILSNWPSILWWTNSLTAEFNISPFATTLWKGNAQLKKKKKRQNFGANCFSFHCQVQFFLHYLSTTSTSFLCPNWSYIYIVYLIQNNGTI